MTVLPDFGEATSRPRCPLPIGAIMSMQRREVFEHDLMFRSLGRLPVDLVHLDESEIAFAVLRRPHFAFNGVARVQIEPPNLRGADVNVVGAREIRHLGRAKEAEAVWQYLERAVAENGL